MASSLYGLQHLSPCKPDTSSRLWSGTTMAIIWVLVMGNNRYFMAQVLKKTFKKSKLEHTYVVGNCRMREELIWVWAGICLVKINRIKYAVKFLIQ